MASFRALSSGASRMLWSILLLFLVSSVSAQYTTAKDGDYCYDPASETSSTVKYSNSSSTATKSYSFTTSLTEPTITGGTPLPTSTSPLTSAAGFAATPELLLGLVAALIARSTTFADLHAIAQL
ncbi:hypothetical protein B0T16DRAFT_389844 [Cercophora newfieldiana]|uniref:Uncharacterized protein n=1 Tax=Cercophora newfieldiana TaxID=92897 RepID=A0AA39YC17_9PEZI|nr:hypothetical protein B0T16DRAFT_389844 [Cercophora newfieldiana]